MHGQQNIKKKLLSTFLSLNLESEQIQIVVLLTQKCAPWNTRKNRKDWKLAQCFGTNSNPELNAAKDYGFASFGWQ